MNLTGIIDKLATGDMIELQILILFAGFLVAMGVMSFVARKLVNKDDNKDIKVGSRPPKSWKNFCHTEKERRQ